MRVVKKHKAFMKSYKQSFTEKIFEITGIPTLNPPIYSSVDADREPIEGNFYQPEFRLVSLLSLKLSNNRFGDEFSIQVFASAPMEIFDSNTLVSFRTFFIEENQLAGDWRVAHTEIILPKKTENF